LHVDAAAIATIVVMTLVPLLFGIGAVVGAVALYPKDLEQRQREPGRRWVSFLLGCLGLLLVLSGLGIGACWGFVITS
jgi:hypothetical protein